MRNQIEVRASVPGHKPEDVTVIVDGGTLTIAAEGQGEKEITEDGFVRRERYQGRRFRERGADRDRPAHRST